MLSLFNGKVLCSETKQYLDNFLAVTRTRPEERADREESAGDISDDELIVGPHNFAKVVKTRVGPLKQVAKERTNMDERTSKVWSRKPQNPRKKPLTLRSACGMYHHSTARFIKKQAVP